MMKIARLITGIRLLVTLVAIGGILEVVLEWTHYGVDTNISLAPEETTFVVGNQRAYAVVFDGADDVLVFERAHVIWNSLAGVKVPGDADSSNIYAIVPQLLRFTLEAPLRTIGYRVLVRDSLVPAWKVSGRFVQKALLGPGARGLLGMEALLLEEYVDVVVLDYMMMVMPAGLSAIPRHFNVMESEGDEGVILDPTQGFEAAKSVLEKLATGKAMNAEKKEDDGDGSARPRPQSRPHGEPDREADPEAEGDLERRRRAGILRKAAEVTGSDLGALDGEKVEPALTGAIGEAEYGPRKQLLGLSEEPGFVEPAQQMSRAGWGGDGEGRMSPRGRTGESRLPRKLEASAGGRPAGSGMTGDVAFAPGDGPFVAPEGSSASHSSVKLLPDALRAMIKGQHPGLMVVRPNRTLYEFLQELLVTENVFFESAYGQQLKGYRVKSGSPGYTAKLEEVAPTTPLLQIALAFSARTTTIPLVQCSGGDGKQASETTGPLAWCTLSPGEGTPDYEAPAADQQGSVEKTAFAWIPVDPCGCVERSGGLGEACRAWVSAAGRENEVSRSTPCRDGKLEFPRSMPPLKDAEEIHQLAFVNARARAPGSTASTAGEEGIRVPPPVWQKRPDHKVTVTAEDLNSFQHFWLANEEKKILIVAIPKVACTQIHALFLRMLGSDHWDTTSLVNVHMHRDQHKYTMSTMLNMTPERATEIMNDPSWTRAVFLRDPAERLLSCYLDKIVHRRSYSLAIFQTKISLSFEKFVQLISPGAKTKYGNEYNRMQLELTKMSNPHWRPQLYFGLDKFLPQFDFVGDFAYVQQHAEELLRRVGLWDEYGASGWGPKGESSFFERATVRGHSTGSSRSFGLYYTLPLLERVRTAYWATDYNLFAGLGWWNESSPAP